MPMFRFTLILLICALSNSISAQDHISFQRKGFTLLFDSTSFKTIKSEDTVLVETIGSDKIKMEFTFDKYNLCDRGIIQFYCNECVDFHIETALFDDQNEWIEVGDNIYIENSRISWDLGWSKHRNSECKKMEIIKTPDNEVKLTIIYSTIVMKTFEWKEIKKEQVVSDSP